MISSEELRAAIREGRITPDEERRLFQTLAEIAFRLWYDGHPAKCEAPGRREGMTEREQAYTDLVKAAKIALFLLRGIPTPEFPKPGHLDGILADQIVNILEAALNNPNIVKPPEATPAGGKA